jgi:predicted HTH transcriptional regulator
LAQFVPIDPELWKVDRFPDFLAARREIIARKLNEFMDSLISEPEETHRRPITDLIKLGESYVLEFKSTLQWDTVKGEQNKVLRHSSVKTINAFMNSEGGTLVMGVEDDGNIYGLERDIALTKNSNDRFEQLLVSLVSDGMGTTTAPNFRIRFEEIGEKSVCVVDVERSPEPVFMKSDKGKAFYIRVGNTSRALDHEETLKYVEANW